jgi:diadenylate cyclase
VIEHLLELIGGQASELWSFLQTNYDPARDTVDVLLVAVGIYWLLLLIKGTRAIQVLVGLGALIGLRVFADFFDLLTLSWLLDNFLGPAVLIVVILFQSDIRRALGRLGRGFLPRLSERQESQIVEEVVRAAQALSARRIGALVVLERRTGLDDQVEAGTALDASVSKDLLTSIFQPGSPLHDGAVLIQQGRVSHAGAVLPLTLRTDLPEGVGTRHRAAVGITEETDAVVVVVSEETGSISVVMGGEMIRGLDAPRLRVVLRDALTRPSDEVPVPEAEPAAPATPTAEAGTP